MNNNSINNNDEIMMKAMVTIGLTIYNDCDTFYYGD